MSNDMYYDNITGEMLDKDLADYTKPNQGRRAAR